MTIRSAGASSQSSGQIKPGVYLPTGWNTNWQAARNASGTTMAEVAIFGDSTTYGACTTTSPNTPIYTWINKLRGLSVAAGYLDGGPGIVYPDTTDNHNYDAIVYQVAKSGFAAALSFQHNPGAYQSSTIGDTITVQGKGSTIRVIYTKQPSMGSFRYRVDAGSWTTINANTASAFTCDMAAVTGLTDAVHTIEFENLGGGSSNWVCVTASFLRSTGIVYNKYAISGNTTSTWFARTNTSIGMFGTQIALGLSPGVTGAPSGTPWDWGVQKLGAGYPHPALAISVLGVNNMQGLTVTTEGGPTTTEQTAALQAAQQVEDDLLHYVRLCRAASIDPMIAVPHYDIALHTHSFGALFSRTVWNAGVMSGCAVVDFNQAIRPTSTMIARGLGAPGVHAEVGTYDAEATFLWDNALSL